MFTITTSTTDLIRYLKTALIAASRDETRQPLCAVQLFVTADSKAAVAATDGHCAVVIQLLGAQVDGSGQAHLLRSDIERLVKSAPKRDDPNARETKIERTADIVTVTMGASTMQLRVPDVQSPPLAEVLPREVYQEIPPPVLSHDMHEQIAKSLSAISPRAKDSAIQVYATSADDPRHAPAAIIASDIPELLFVAMPMREPKKRPWQLPRLGSFRELLTPPSKSAAKAA